MLTLDNAETSLGVPKSGPRRGESSEEPELSLVKESLCQCAAQDKDSWLSFCHHQFIRSFSYFFRTYLLSSCQTLAGTGGPVEPKTDQVPAGPGADLLQVGSGWGDRQEKHKQPTGCFLRIMSALKSRNLEPWVESE